MSEQMDFNDGKYTVIFDNGRLTALRNGEPWNRDITGDNLIYWMLVEAIRLKEERDASAAKLANVEGQLAAVERLRPMWAQGHSTDSVAAQVSAAALTSLWDLLGVGNQTSAVVKLKQLLCVSAERDDLAVKLKKLETEQILRRPSHRPSALIADLEAMAASLEGSGRLDKHDHPSAYATILDVIKWMSWVEAGIPFKWNMSESHPRPAAPGKLTFFHDHVQDQFEITWEPENDLLPKSN